MRKRIVIGRAVEGIQKNNAFQAEDPVGVIVMLLLPSGTRMPNDNRHPRGHTCSFVATCSAKTFTARHVLLEEFDNDAVGCNGWFAVVYLLPTESVLAFSPQ